MRFLTNMSICMVLWMFVCMADICPAQAQSAARVSVEKMSVRNIDDKVIVRLRLVLDSLEVASNHALELRPLITDGENIREMNPLVVAGRRQSIVYQRMNREGMLVRRDEGEMQQVDYADTLDYEAWMDGADFMLAEDLCGCGGNPLEQNKLILQKLDFDTSVYELEPVLAFAVPRVEAVKHREESGRAFLDFPVNQTEIYPEYRRNTAELDKIRKTIELVENDTNTTITHIVIHGYASPEGSFANNRRLAQGRAEALKRYVCRLYSFRDTVFTVRSTPEDWQGLQRWVEQSHLKEREEILKIIASPVDEDEKNVLLQRIGDGSVYAYLLRQVYPSLRHSDYTVHYTVRPFSEEEARRLLKTRPQLLSLNEMYLVAQGYDFGSECFKEVFDIAVRLFPEDETANLNAALVAVSEHNYIRATRYIEKAGNSPEAIHARGVLCLVKGEYGQAEKFLLQAKKLGVRQAEENLEQLRLKLENNRKTGNMSDY